MPTNRCIQKRMLRQSRLFITYSLHHAITAETEGQLIMKKMADAACVVSKPFHPNTTCLKSPKSPLASPLSSPLLSSPLLSAAMASELGSWLEGELERLGVCSAAERRATRDQLAQRLAGALRGQLRELSRLSPIEKLVMEPIAVGRAAEAPAMADPVHQFEPFADVETRLQHMCDDVALYSFRERAALAREAFERKLSRRDEKIRRLQLVVDAVDDELRKTRERADRTQAQLEDALLEKTIEAGEMRARAECAEAKLRELQDEQRAKEQRPLGRQASSGSLAGSQASQPAGLPARNLDGALATAATGSSSAVCAMWQSTARETLRIRADA